MEGKCGDNVEGEYNRVEWRYEELVLAVAAGNTSDSFFSCFPDQAR